MPEYPNEYEGHTCGPYCEHPQPYDRPATSTPGQGWIRSTETGEVVSTGTTPDDPIAEALSRRWGGDYRFPGMPEQLWKDANAAYTALRQELAELYQTAYDRANKLMAETTRAERAEARVAELEAETRGLLEANTELELRLAETNAALFAPTNSAERALQDIGDLPSAAEMQAVVDEIREAFNGPIDERGWQHPKSDTHVDKHDNEC